MIAPDRAGIPTGTTPAPAREPPTGARRPPPVLERLGGAPVPLRIGIDATQAGVAGSAHTGVYQYMYQLIRQMGRMSPASELRMMFALPRSRHTPSIQAFCQAVDLPNAVACRCRVPSRHLMRWRIPVDLFTGPVDVFHAPAHIGYAARRCPVVVTVHDLAYLRDLGGPTPPPGLDAQATANWHGRHRFFAELSRHMEHSVASATRIIAVSQATADDLVHSLGVDRAKVRVVHLGVRDEIRRVGHAHQQPVLDRHRLEPGHLLYVGSLDPNKNIPRLIDGYALYRRAGGRRPLVIAGHSDFFGAVLRAQCERLGIADAVRFLGFVADADLPALYSSAFAVVMPSPLEGFGLPAIEAMACGTPVVGVDAGALPEVIGSAGLLARHDQAQTFADAFRALEDDPALCASLIERGRHRAAEFTWQRAARETLAVYADAAGQATGR